MFIQHASWDSCTPASETIDPSSCSRLPATATFSLQWRHPEVRGEGPQAVQQQQHHRWRPR